MHTQSQNKEIRIRNKCRAKLHKQCYKQSGNINNDRHQYEKSVNNKKRPRNVNIGDEHHNGGIISDVDVEHNTDEFTLSHHEISKQPIVRTLTMDTSTVEAKSPLSNVQTQEKQFASAVCSRIEMIKSPELPLTDPMQQKRCISPLYSIDAMTKSLSPSSNNPIQQQKPIFSLYSNDTMNINEPPTKKRKMDDTLVTCNNKDHNLIEKVYDNNEEIIGGDCNNINVIEDNVRNRQISHTMLNEESINNNTNNQHTNDKNTNVIQCYQSINHIPAFSKMVSELRRQLNLAWAKINELHQVNEGLSQKSIQRLNATKAEINDLRKNNKKLTQTGI